MPRKKQQSPTLELEADFKKSLESLDSEINNILRKYFRSIYLIIFLGIFTSFLLGFTIGLNF